MSGKERGETGSTTPTGNDAVLRLNEVKQQRRPDAAPAPAKAAPGVTPLRPPARPARLRGRHWIAVLSFLVCVVLPTAASWWYVTERAVDRYLSTASFSIRSEEAGSAFELLGGVVDVGASSSSDPDILYDFMQSQEMVERIDARIDLRALWAKGDPVRDPVFGYHPPGTIEDMVDYWNRMVGVYNDTSTGIMDIAVQAFTPADAQLVANLIYEESSDMINRLSDIAQEDATRISRIELDAAVERLKEAREAVTLFRNRNQIVDPLADMQGQMGILSSLQSELATTMIDLDVLRQTTATSDPRILQAEQRIAVIEARIAEERAKLGIGSGDPALGPAASAFADLVGEYERLMVDLEFAQASYAAARTTFETAQSEARRQKRYIAAHVQPTLAERALYPRAGVVVSLVGLFLFLGWALLLLMAYALKDRR
jgi:capsular polysaccharide transport system permease protein